MKRRLTGRLFHIRSNIDCLLNKAAPNLIAARNFGTLNFQKGFLMRNFFLGFIAFMATVSGPAFAASNCETLCQAEFYQTATATIVRQLIDDGADVNATDPDGKTPLHWVARATPEAIQALIAAGADVNAKDNLDRTPFHFVSAMAAPEIVVLFLNAGADVNAKTANYWTPLHGVAKFGSPEVVKILLEAGADASATNEMAETPFDLAATNERVKASPEYQILREASGH
ncbi:ankyrin repeat domain-containing protein [Parasedimentitalea marina]|uniref:Ankyrin repeat domain-containing protein n=2 Tax=Parasedimentitalea marina TaxID=2483033 RepID=A0A3T0N5L0_9RHOB|nr:ankyrin repeat domain-containing protein [Parasedimentitalea marina]